MFRCFYGYSLQNVLLRLLWMAFGKCVLRLADQFSFLDSMVWCPPNHSHCIISIVSPVSIISSLSWTAGELICPAYHELCNTYSNPLSRHCPNSCNFNGDCVDGRCHCLPGFHGHDCSKRELLIPFLDSVWFLTFMILCEFLTRVLYAGFCPSNCNGHGKCLQNGICECAKGYTGIDCSTGKAISFQRVFISSFCCFFFYFFSSCMFVIKENWSWKIIATFPETVFVEKFPKNTPFLEAIVNCSLNSW